MMAILEHCSGVRTDIHRKGFLARWVFIRQVAQTDSGVGTDVMTELLYVVPTIIRASKKFGTALCKPGGALRGLSKYVGDPRKALMSRQEVDNKSDRLKY
jgi:hypothetical protein